MLHETPKKKMSAKKKTAVIVGSVIGVLAVLCLVGYLIVNGYLSKIHYVSGDQKIASSIAPQKDGTGSDSPQSTIDDINKKIEENMKNNSTQLMYDQDVYNVLLIGSDTRVKGGSGRSDTMILVSINKKTQKIVETSLLRDIYVGIPGVSSGDRLNAAYAYGGADLLLKTVEQNFKVKVDKYIAVDFYSFINLVDQVGGVTITISNDELPVANSYVHSLNNVMGAPYDDSVISKSGEQKVNGKQALAYSRIRYVGNADWGRTDRQRTVLNQVIGKIKGMNFFQMNDLLNNFLPQISTNVSKGELFSMILSVPTYSKYQVVSWSVPQPGTYTSAQIRGMDVLSLNFNTAIQQIKDKVYG